MKKQKTTLSDNQIEQIKKEARKEVIDFTQEMIVRFNNGFKQNNHLMTPIKLEDVTYNFNLLSRIVENKFS